MVTFYAAWLSVQEFDLLPTRYIYVSDVDLKQAEFVSLYNINCLVFIDNAD